MSNNTLQTAERTFMVLECFSFDKLELSFTDIMNETKLAKATLSRVIATLENSNYLVRNDETGKYSLDYKVYLLGLIAEKGSRLVKEFNPIVEKLSEKYNQNINVYLLNNMRRVSFIQKKSPMSSKTNIELGGSYPLYQGAAGKSIMAFIKEDEKMQLLNEMVDLGYKDLESFKFELDKIQKEKIAIDKRENLDDINCISVPVFDNFGVIGCISVSGVQYIYPKDTTVLESDLKDYSEALSSKLGYKDKSLRFLE